MKGARIGVVRDPLDPRADPTSADFKQVRAVIDRAIADLRRLGADIVEPVAIPGVAARSARLYDENVYETEAATNAYLAQHPNAPAKTLSDILVSGKVAPARARVLMRVLGHSTSEVGYLELLLAREQLRQDVLVEMANKKLDALVYATFDHQPIVIPADATTRTVLDSSGPGNNRRLSPVLGIPGPDRARRVHRRRAPGRARVHESGIQRAAALQARRMPTSRGHGIASLPRRLQR